jgi:hypothetical protein
MSTSLTDITPLLASTRKSAASLALSSDEVKLAILADLASRLIAHVDDILIENGRNNGSSI